MRTKSAAKIITRDPAWLGPAIHPGEMLREEFLKPLGLTQVELARELGTSVNRLNELVLGKRGVTADTALRLARRFKTTPAVLDASAGRLGFAPGHAKDVRGLAFHRPSIEIRALRDRRIPPTRSRRSKHSLTTSF